MTRTREDILDDAIAVLRQGETLTLDAVAKQAGMTKPGVVHHFPTKEALAVGVVDHVLDHWEAELSERVEAGADPVDRLRTYVQFTLMDDFDSSDLAMLADIRLRDQLAEQWASRLDSWFGPELDHDDPQHARHQAARMLADGAWFDRGLGIVTLDNEERSALLQVALRLIDKGGPA